MIGAIISIILEIWMAVGQQIAKASGELNLIEKPVSIENCPCFNGTIETSSSEQS